MNNVERVVESQRLHFDDFFDGFCSTPSSRRSLFDVFRST